MRSAPHTTRAVSDGVVHVRGLGIAGVALNAAALTATLWHVSIDGHIGLYGATSQSMSFVAALHSLMDPVIAGVWLYATALAVQGSRSGRSAALTFAFVHAFVMNGVVAFLAAPPPSAAFPYQDLSHALALLLGGLATVALWRVQKPQRGRVRPVAIGVPLALILLGQALGALLHFA